MSESNAGHSPPRPGSEHSRLEPFSGVFRARVSLFMGPGNTFESQGTMVNAWQVNGLFLQQTYTGDAAEGQQPGFQGRGYWGYNTVSGKYEGFWIDTASTMMHVETGDVGESGKIWTMHSEVVHPYSRQKVRRRNVITLIDFNQHRMDSYITNSDGNEIKTMEIEYTRA